MYIRERPRGGRNNALVDDEMRQCLEEIINENCVLTCTLSQINGDNLVLSTELTM